MDLENEQQTTEPTAPAIEPSERDDLIAALREAVPGGADAVNDEATPEERAAAEAASPATPAATEPDPDEPKVSRLLREREKAHAERMASDDYATRRRSEADAERQRIIEEARAEARKAAEDERDRFRKEFAADPLDRIKQVGTPEEVADAIARAGSPEYRAEQALRRELAELREQAAAGVDVRKQFEAFRKEQEQAKQQAEQQKTYEAFFEKYASKELAPHLHARYDRDEIIHHGVRLANEWVKSGLEYGKEFDDGDVAQYLEADAMKRFSALGITPAPQVRAAPGSPGGNASKVSANGSRTISAAAGSERRATQKPIHEMTAAEERQALIEASSEAKRAFGKA